MTGKLQKLLFHLKSCSGNSFFYAFFCHVKLFVDPFCYLSYTQLVTKARVKLSKDVFQGLLLLMA